MKEFSFDTSSNPSLRGVKEEHFWRIAMAVKLPLPPAAVTALSQFTDNHASLLTEARVPSIKYFKLQDVPAEGGHNDAKTANAPDAFQQLGGAYGQAGDKDRDQRYKGICINLADAARSGECTEAVKILLVTLWNELTRVGAEFYYPEAPTGDTNIMYTDAIGRELLTPFSYSACKPYEQTHGILFEEKYNPKNHPDPIDGIFFTPADLEGTRIQAPTVALYQEAIETENTYHQKALRALQQEITTLSQEAKNESASIIADLVKARAELKEAKVQLEEATNQHSAIVDFQIAHLGERRPNEDKDALEKVMREKSEADSRINDAKTQLEKAEVTFTNSEKETSEPFQKKLNNLIKKGTEFGNAREAVREAPEDKKKLHLFLEREAQNELEKALTESKTDVQRNLALNQATRAYYLHTLKPLVDQLLQGPYFKYYPKTPWKGKLLDSDPLVGFNDLLIEKKLTQEGDVTQKQGEAKAKLNTLVDEKATQIETIQDLIANDSQLPLEEKSREAGLRRQLVDLAAYRPNEAMVLYWRLVHIVQGKKAISRLKEQKTAAEAKKETQAQIDLFNRLRSEPLDYQKQRKEDLIKAIRSKTLEAANAFECGSKYYSSWGKRAGQSFGLIVIAAAGALGGAGLAGDFSAVKTFGDIFTATGADITAFESHTWIFMSVCAVLFLAAAVVGACWDRHHGQGERAAADELRSTAAASQV